VWGQRGIVIVRFVAAQSIYSKYLVSLQNEFIYGGYLTSLGCPAIVISESLLLNVPVNLPILVISFLLPLIVYSYNYYSEIEADMSGSRERALFLKDTAREFPYITGLYVVFLILFLVLHANIHTALFVLLLVAGGIAYTLFFKKLTRKIPFFKSVFVSLVWASAGAFLLLIYHYEDPGFAALLLFAYIFLKGMINTTYFDLKDMLADSSQGLKTLPVLLGKERTLKYLHAINLIAILPIVAGVATGALPAFALAMVGFYFYDRYYIGKAKAADNKDLLTFSYVFADAEFLLWPVLLVIAKALFT